jgi:hypothetical protein
MPRLISSLLLVGFFMKLYRPNGLPIAFPVFHCNLDRFQPIRQLPDQFFHYLPGVLVENLDVSIGLAAGGADQVRDAAQDQAA